MLLECALLALAGTVSLPATSNFHQQSSQVYALSGKGRVSLQNINGDVHIRAWDRNQVRIDAVKTASSRNLLNEALVVIDSSADSISIRTRYADGSNPNPGKVEFTVMVPRHSRLSEIKLINGRLDVNAVSGEVNASCINGRLEARNLAGRARLSTINGRLEATFDQLAGHSVELNSVNGSVDLTIPSDSKAEIEASTVSGGINNDFGLHVNNHHFVGHDLRGELGSGGTRIKLANVNGRIEVHHAQDGRALSPVKDLNHGDKDDDDDDSSI